VSVPLGLGIPGARSGSAAGRPLRHRHLYLGDEAEKQALLLSGPEAFFTTSTYDWSPLVVIRLEPIDITRLRG
jgi:hypothetical protein